MAVYNTDTGDYTNPIPTKADGSQVGSGIPWAPGSSAPSGAPAGYTWDPNLFMFQSSPGTAATGSQVQATAPNNHGRVDQALQSAKSTDDPTYWYQKLDSDPNGYGSAWDYWAGRIAQGDGAEGVRNGTVQKFQDGPAQGAATGVGAGGNYSATNPFSDPATKGYVDLLNSRIQSLLTPQQNPDMNPLLEYMRKYFAQLQQPAYSDQQRAIIQTQQTDPMERQRQARKQQIIEQMATRGMGPSDGPTVSALADVDRQYDSLRAQAQGGQAVNEINLGRQNQQQAVDVGSAIASLQNGMFQQQDQRANQAVNSAAQIPNMAQQRLQQAIQLLNGNNVNPASLVNSLQGFQQQGLNQNTSDSKYWAEIIAAMAKAFGL